MDKTELIITTAKDILIAYNKNLYTDPAKFSTVVNLVADAVDSLIERYPVKTSAE